MMLEIFDIHVNIYLSFSVIIATLTLSIIFSVLVPKKDNVSEKILDENKSSGNA
jgi:tellurite resistance protein TerC